VITQIFNLKTIT